MKFIKLVLLFIIIISSIIAPKNSFFIFADGDMTYEEIEQKLEETLNGQLDNLDLSQLEEIIASLNNEESGFFESSSFIEKIKQITQGNAGINSASIWQNIVNLFFNDLAKFLPLLSVVITIAISYSLVSNSRPKLKKSAIGDIIHFVCFGSIIVLIMASMLNMIKLTTNTISDIKTQIDITFPILLTMLTAMGSTATSTIFQPSIALLSGSIMSIFTNILMPLFIFRLVFSILSNLTSNVKFNKFADLFYTIFKWLIGFIFTLFLGFMTIQGISAGSFDGVSIRAAKYAIKNSVPLLGGYLSDGMNLILSSSILIKNAVGVGGIILLFSTIIIPIINLIVFMILLKFTSAILEPLADSRISNFVEMLSKSVSMLIVIILGVSFMYVIMTGMIIASGNYL